MLTKIQKWGNSQGLRLNKVLLEEIHLTVGDAVNMYSQEGKIVIEPVRRSRKTYDLKSLVAAIPEDYKPEETDWGTPVGKEEW